MEKDEIREYLEVVTGAKRPQEGLSIREALERLDRIAADKTLPGDLAHYLSRRSYLKALEWLDHPDMTHQV